MEQIVTPFATPINSLDDPPSWKSADEAVGVRWEDHAPRNNGTEYVRYGTSKLRGRGTADVGFTGTRATVSEIDIGISEKDGKTFEPNQFSEVLRSQFGPKTAIRLLYKCGSPDSAVYEVTLETRKPIYVMVMTDLGGSRPNTRSSHFQFSRRNEERWACNP